jgi:hypothetical protein
LRFQLKIPGEAIILRPNEIFRLPANIKVSLSAVDPPIRRYIYARKHLSFSRAVV